MQQSLSLGSLFSMRIKVFRFFLGFFCALGFSGFLMAQMPGDCVKVSANGSVERPRLNVYNPVLIHELESILKSIQKQSSYAAPIQIRVLARGEKIIYAEAQGDISISIGFIQACKHKAELAFVLAHELAHLELRHSYSKSHYASISSGNEVYIEKEADKRALELVKAVGYSTFSAESSFGIFTKQNTEFKPISERFFPSGMPQYETQNTYFEDLPYDGFYEERQAIAERMKLLASRNSTIPTTRFDSLLIPNEVLHQANLELIQAYLMESKPIRALQIWLADSIFDLQMERHKASIVFQLASLKNAMALPMPHGMGNRELNQLESIFFRWTAKEVSAWALRHMYDAHVRFPHDSAFLLPLTESVAMQLSFNGKQTWNAFSRNPFDAKKYLLLNDSLKKIDSQTDWPAWKRFALKEKLSSQLELPVFFQAGEMIDSDWFLELKSAYQRFSPNLATKTLDWFSGRGSLYPSLLLGTHWLPMDASMLNGVQANPIGNSAVLKPHKRVEGNQLTCSDKAKLWDLCFSLLENPAREQIPANHLEILKIRKEHGVRYLGLLVRNSKSEHSFSSQPYIFWLPSALDQMPDLPESKTKAWVVFIDLANYSIRFCLPLNSSKAFESPWEYARDTFPF
jgi:hypothetical protein